MGAFRDEKASWLPNLAVCQYLGGAYGAASGAPRAGLWPWGGPARRARAVPAERHYLSAWPNCHGGGRYSARPSSPLSIVQLAATASMPPSGVAAQCRVVKGRCAIGFAEH
jgi:hypothetical protein